MDAIPYILHTQVVNSFSQHEEVGFSVDFHNFLICLVLSLGGEGVPLPLNNNRFWVRVLGGVGVGDGGRRMEGEVTPSETGEFRWTLHQQICPRQISAGLPLSVQVRG